MGVEDVSGFDMLGGSGIAHRAKNVLEAGLGSAIAELNARPDAPVQLEAPGEFYLYGEPSGAFPDLAIRGVAVEVSVPDIDYDNLDIHELAADAASVLQVTVWAEEAVDFPAMIDRLHLYASAVISTLRGQGRLAPGSVLRRAAVRVRAADVEPDNPRSTTVRAGAAVICYIDHDESLSL